MNHEQFMSQWIRADFHIRGCMLESLAQDLDLFGESKERRKEIYDILRSIAAYMK